MPTDKVIVVMERAEVEDLIGCCPVGWVQTDGLRKLHAALDTDRGELRNRIIRAVRAVEAAGADPYYPAVADAVLHAIEEGADRWEVTV